MEYLIVSEEKSSDFQKLLDIWISIALRKINGSAKKAKNKEKWIAPYR